MSSLRTILGSVTLFVATVADPIVATALPVSPSERAMAFAQCTGRYSAEAAHARLFDGAISEQAELRRATFEALLSAVLPDAVDYGMPEELPMSWRVTAKANHARLLSTSVFNMAPERADRARDAATQYIAACDALLLGA